MQHTHLVVRELNVTPVDALAPVLLLLHLEHKLVKLLLQRLVGIVDAQLLKVVVLEVLEAKNVKHTCVVVGEITVRPSRAETACTNKAVALLSCANVGVHVGDNPIKQPAIHRLGHSIPRLQSLQSLQQR